MNSFLFLLTFLGFFCVVLVVFSAISQQRPQRGRAAGTGLLAADEAVRWKAKQVNERRGHFRSVSIIPVYLFVTKDGGQFTYKQTPTKESVTPK